MSQDFQCENLSDQNFHTQLLKTHRQKYRGEYPLLIYIRDPSEFALNAVVSALCSYTGQEK